MKDSRSDRWKMHRKDKTQEKAKDNSEKIQISRNGLAVTHTHTHTQHINMKRTKADLTADGKDAN